jgi:hypothetical protein
MTNEMINLIEKEVNEAISGVMTDDKVLETVNRNLLLLSSSTLLTEMLSKNAALTSLRIL